MMPIILKGAMWAGVIALDFTAFGPFMISQPLVCGPLFGWLLGNVTVGLLIGGIMQLLWMDLSPVGVGIPYDATATTLLATFWAAMPGNSALSQVVLCMALALPFGFFFRWVDQAARRLNTKAAHWIDGLPDSYLVLGLRFAIAASIVWTWLRYAVLYGIVFSLGNLLWKRIAYIPKLTPMDQGLTMAVILLPVAGLGVALALFLTEDVENAYLKRGTKTGRKGDL